LRIGILTSQVIKRTKCKNIDAFLDTNLAKQVNNFAFNPKEFLHLPNQLLFNTL